MCYVLNRQFNWFILFMRFFVLVVPLASIASMITSSCGLLLFLICLQTKSVLAHVLVPFLLYIFLSFIRGALSSVSCSSQVLLAIIAFMNFSEFASKVVIKLLVFARIPHYMHYLEVYLPCLGIAKAYALARGKKASILLPQLFSKLVI